MRKNFLLAALIVVAASAAGCGGNSGESSGPCTPGRSISCGCPDGRGGAQICLVDGTYGDCRCEGEDGNDGTDSGLLSTDASSTDSGVARPPSVPAGKSRVFVTSAVYRGGIAALGSGGALAVADKLCQEAAVGALLGGKWKAWLSDKEVNAIDRLAEAGPWHTLDGALVFNNKANIRTTPLAPIEIDEHNRLVHGAYVWTGTGSGGVGTASTCGSWSYTDAYFIATVGVTDEMGSGWTDAGTEDCWDEAHLYCFEQ